MADDVSFAMYPFFETSTLNGGRGEIGEKKLYALSLFVS
jgi:hypothetical protein